MVEKFKNVKGSSQIETERLPSRIEARNRRAKTPLIPKEPDLKEVLKEIEESAAL